MTLPGVRPSLVSNPFTPDACSSPVNHHQIFPLVGIPVSTYPYYDPQTIGLAFDKFLATLEAAPTRSVFLLHACAHNPTGVDPTREQWSQIADVFIAKGHFAFFDSAYQGFASGDLDNDAWAVREFVRREVPLLVCQVRVRAASGRIAARTMSQRGDVDAFARRTHQADDDMSPRLSCVGLRDLLPSGRQR